MLAVRGMQNSSAKPLLGVELALAKPLRCAMCSKEGRGARSTAKLCLLF